MAEFSLYQTPDGDLTLFHPRYGEHYSSRHGPQAQSETVFVRGSGTHLHPAPRVLEVGFGLGLNFRTTLRFAPRVEYLAYEAHPLPSTWLRAVSAAETHPCWLALLDAWDEAAARGSLELTAGGAHLQLYFGDVTQASLPANWASAVYLDGFSPAKNPEVWTPSFTARLAGSLLPGGRLATYSAAGAVRRALASAGLRVEKRSGLRGKREFVVATRP